MILVVDDDPSTARQHADLLESLGYRITIQNDPYEVIPTVNRIPEIALVLLDLRMPGMDGFAVLQQLRAQHPQIGVVIATVADDIASAIQAIKSGAWNYLLKPLSAPVLSEVIQSFLTDRSINQIGGPQFSSFVTGENSFSRTFSNIRAFAVTNRPILIQGESGTGKEIIATIIHSLSDRRSGLFAKEDAWLLATDQFDLRLFGAAQPQPGDWTAESQMGALDRAAGGTLYIEEIGELTIAQQKAWLTLMKNYSYSRIGETKRTRLRARLIFSSSEDLAARTKGGSFLPELYRLLATYTVPIPPLRERRGDIAILTEHFLRKYGVQHGRLINGISKEALECLENYSFPGNVRELEGIIGSAVLLEQGMQLSRDSLPRYLTEAGKPPGESLELLRYNSIMQALQQHGGNQTRAAKQLGIARGTLNRLVNQYKREGKLPA